MKTLEEEVKAMLSFIDIKIAKTFYEIEEDTSNVDFELNQRNIRRRNLLQKSIKDAKHNLYKEESK